MDYPLRLPSVFDLCRAGEMLPNYDVEAQRPGGTSATSPHARSSTPWWKKHGKRKPTSPLGSPSCILHGVVRRKLWGDESSSEDLDAEEVGCIFFPLARNKDPSPSIRAACPSAPCPSAMDQSPSIPKVIVSPENVFSDVANKKLDVEESMTYSLSIPSRAISSTPLYYCASVVNGNFFILFSSAPPDIKNWFPDYEYESPGSESWMPDLNNLFPDYESSKDDDTGNHN